MLVPKPPFTTSELFRLNNRPEAELGIPYITKAVAKYLREKYGYWQKACRLSGAAVTTCWVEGPAPVKPESPKPDISWIEQEPTEITDKQLEMLEFFKRR